MPKTITQKANETLRNLKSLLQERDSISLREVELFWEEARVLYELRERGLFRLSQNASGKSWTVFLHQIKIPFRTAKFKISIYKKWVKDLRYSPNNLKGIHTRKLHVAIPYAQSKKDAEKILKKARELNLSDFLKWLKETFR